MKFNYRSHCLLALFRQLINVISNTNKLLPTNEKFTYFGASKCVCRLLMELVDGSNCINIAHWAAIKAQRSIELTYVCWRKWVCSESSYSHRTMQLRWRFLCRDAISIVAERTVSKRISLVLFEQIPKVTSRVRYLYWIIFQTHSQF